MLTLLRVKVLLLNGEIPCRILKLKRKPPKLNCYKTKLTIYYKGSNSDMLLNLNNLKMKNIKCFLLNGRTQGQACNKCTCLAAPMLMLSWLTACADIL